MKNTALRLFRISRPLFASCALGLTGATAGEPLSTDRPDATESPHPVPVGRWQIESDFVVYERDSAIPGEPGSRSEHWSGGVTNFKYGLAADVDVQLVVEPYRREVSHDAAGLRSTAEGVGDLTLRLKWRFLDRGDAGGALALLPYVKLPTAGKGLGNGAVEAGFVVPYGRDLSPAWSWGFQVGADWRRLDPAERSSYGLVPGATVVLGQEITEMLGFFYEVAAAVDLEADADAWEVTLNTGATYALGPLRQLDFGIMAGITRGAADLTLLAGYSQRW